MMTLGMSLRHGGGLQFSTTPNCRALSPPFTFPAMQACLHREAGFPAKPGCLAAEQASHGRVKQVITIMSPVSAHSKITTVG